MKKKLKVKKITLKNGEAVYSTSIDKALEVSNLEDMVNAEEKEVLVSIDNETILKYGKIEEQKEGAK